MNELITVVSWADVEDALARVEAALSADDANLLRAALALRGRGLTIAEYQQTGLALAEANGERPAMDARASVRRE